MSYHSSFPGCPWSDGRRIMPSHNDADPTEQAATIDFAPPPMQSQASAEYLRSQTHSSPTCICREFSGREFVGSAKLNGPSSCHVLGSGRRTICFRSTEMPRSGVSESGRKEIRREGKGQHSTKGGMCVGSFAHANIQHPQAKEAERQKGKEYGDTQIGGKVFFLL